MFDKSEYNSIKKIGLDSEQILASAMLYSIKCKLIRLKEKSPRSTKSSNCIKTPRSTCKGWDKNSVTEVFLLFTEEVGELAKSSSQRDRI